MHFLHGSWQPSFAWFLQDCAAIGVEDIQGIKEAALQTLKYLRSSKGERREIAALQALQVDWYESLARGVPKYEVYASPYYLAELFACWVTYSRKYLAELLQPKLFPPLGIAQSLGEVRKVVDLGCGIGYSTAALRELFPTATIAATNFPGIPQTRIAERLGSSWRFVVYPDVKPIGGGVDLVFASEYFEHIPAPVDHLAEVVEALEPRALLIANTFNSPSIGHFPSYAVGGVQVSGKQTTKAFNSFLRSRGYEKCKTKLWNDRPNFWKRS